ncbi:MAG: hypothetical protein KDF65_02905, partial [Anaerolineae bacterium]|nr:hypothetical protein [Anaerolineae bacterium]
METPLTLVIDQGTHSTRAIAFDGNGQVRASAFCPVALRGHGTATVEQDAAEIAASMAQVVEAVLAEPLVRRLGVASAGLTTQRSTVAAWDKLTGQPLAPLLSWQDRRVAA